MQILTYPVGVVVGVLPLVVELGLPPKPASLLLDGTTVCALTAQAPGCSVDLGPVPRIHLLELVRTNESGHVVERTSRWVNRPGADQAEVQTRTTCPASSASRTVVIGWAHPERANPSRIRTALDGKSVPLPKNRTLTVSAGTARGTLLTVELTFPDGRRATHAAAVGGRTRGDEDVSIVPILHEGACMAAGLAGVRYGYQRAGLSVRAIESGETRDWQVTFVAEPSVLATLRSWFEERKASLFGSRRLLVPDRIERVFGGRGNLEALTGVVAEGNLQELDLLQGANPEYWVERLSAALRRAGSAPLRTGDAAVAGGFRAGAAPRRRAVVLLLGSGTADLSVLPAGGVQKYLDEIRVPFEVWNLVDEDRPDWPGAFRVSLPEDFYEALVALRRRVACQAIAWVESDFRAASAAARSADSALKYLPETPASAMPLATPSDDVTKRTLEKVRSKER